MKKWVYIFILGSLFSFCFVGDIGFSYPEYFPEPIYSFENNPLDPHKIELGRALFYDPILSKDNSISCASCHSPYNAFAHTDHDLSHGINDEIGDRNAPALFNLAWTKHFMWDGAVNHLDVQALAPIEHPKEMGENFEKVIEKLKASDLYQELFKVAYGNEQITGENTLKALSQFQLTLVSSNSKYDRIKREEDAYTVQEGAGYKLFKTHCETCHQEPLFTNGGFANNGLAVDTTLNDYGRMALTSNPEDSLLFKVPSLRNLEYSFPYMHDGRFSTLSKVIKHYTDGIHESDTLGESLKDGITLDQNERVDLLAFLLTLTDQEFVFNPKHQFPREILLRAKE